MTHNRRMELYIPDILGLFWAKNAIFGLQRLFLAILISPCPWVNFYDFHYSYNIDYIQDGYRSSWACHHFKLLSNKLVHSKDLLLFWSSRTCWNNLWTTFMREGRFLWRMYGSKYNWGEFSKWSSKTSSSDIISKTHERQTLMVKYLFQRDTVHFYAIVVLSIDTV